MDVDIHLPSCLGLHKCYRQAWELLQMEKKTKPNKADKTARRGLWTCRGHYHLLRFLNQTYWASPRLGETCRSQSGNAYSCNKTTFRDCFGYSKDVVFRCPMGRMFSRFRELTGDSAVTGFFSVCPHMKMNMKYSPLAVRSHRIPVALKLHLLPT